MALTWTISGTDKSSIIRQTVGLGSSTQAGWSLTECAMRGQVGACQIVIDDESGSYIPPGQKSITVDESAAATVRMFTGYIAERSAAQGDKAPGQRQWTTTLEDSNVLLDDRIITGSTGNRPSETDVARILWLISDASVGSMTTGVIPNTNTVTMDAIDYRGKRPRDVLEDCAQKAGKNFFVYRFGSGPLLFYDLDTSTNLRSTSRISDVLADVDSTTTFAAKSPRYSLDPSRVYSKVRVRYKGGSVVVSNATTASTYRTREQSKRWMRVKTNARATEQAQKWLDQAAQESTNVECSLEVDAAYVNDIRAGHAVQIKLTRLGIASFTYYRVISRTVTPLSDVRYSIALTLADTVRPTHYAPGGDESDSEEQSNGTDDAASVIIDNGGITVTGGSISVTNSNGVVVIDGSSQMFNVVAGLSIALPQNTKRGEVTRTQWVATGLTNDPLTIWSTKRYTGAGDWSQALPIVVHNTSGQILEYYAGRARYNRKGSTDGTDVQAHKATTVPPLAATTFYVRILRQKAI